MDGFSKPFSLVLQERYFEPWNTAAYGTMDSNLNHLARDGNGAIEGQKSLSFYTHPQGFEQAENCVTRVYILSYDTIIKSRGRLIGMVSQHLGNSKDNN